MVKSKSAGTRKGFTLIELTLAVAFISVLLITISLVTSEIINIYRKGYAMKSINQVGRDLVEELTTAVTESPSADFAADCESFSAGANDCSTDKGFKTAYHQFYVSRSGDFDIPSNIDDDSSTSEALPVGGVFCTGKYSYVWNTGYMLGTIYNRNTSLLKPITVKFKDGTWTGFRLLRFEDIGRAACRHNDNYNNLSNYNSLTSGMPFVIDVDGANILKADATELISEMDSSVVLYDLVIFPPAKTTSGNLLYSGAFVLGTMNSSVDIMSSSSYCRDSEALDADSSYCAVNRFEFTTQATGM